MTFESNQPHPLEQRAIAERIVAGFYRRLERPEPRFIWVDDPVSCAIARQVLDSLGNQHRRDKASARARF